MPYFTNPSIPGHKVDLSTKPLPSSVEINDEVPEVRIFLNVDLWWGWIGILQITSYVILFDRRVRWMSKVEHKMRSWSLIFT